MEEQRRASATSAHPTSALVRDKRHVALAFKVNDDFDYKGPSRACLGTHCSEAQQMRKQTDALDQYRDVTTRYRCEVYKRREAREKEMQRQSGPLKQGRHEHITR